MHEGEVTVTETGLHINGVHYVGAQGGLLRFFEGVDIPWSLLPTGAYAGTVMLISLDVAVDPAQVRCTLGGAPNGMIPPVPVEVIPLALYYIGADGRPERLADFRSEYGPDPERRWHGVPIEREGGGDGDDEPDLAPAD